MARCRKGDGRLRALRLAALAYPGAGLGFSIYFMILQFAYIHAFCIYCMVSALATLLLFMAALAHWRATAGDYAPAGHCC